MCSSAVLSVLASGAIRAAGGSPANPPQLDHAMLFGFLWTLLTVVCFGHRRFAPRFMLAFAICLAVMSVYGATQAAWSLAVIAALWSAATFRQWHYVRPSQQRTIVTRASNTPHTSRVCDESRMSRMFGAS